MMETQNDTEPLLACSHLLSSVGEGLVRSNCTLLIDHVCEEMLCVTNSFVLKYLYIRSESNYSS